MDNDPKHAGDSACHSECNGNSAPQKCGVPNNLKKLGRMQKVLQVAITEKQDKIFCFGVARDFRFSY